MDQRRYNLKCDVIYEMISKQFLEKWAKNYGQVENVYS